MKSIDHVHIYVEVIVVVVTSVTIYNIVIIFNYLLMKITLQKLV